VNAVYGVVVSRSSVNRALSIQNLALHMSSAYEAVLLVSFGGPERPEDVVPFLENVTRGKGVSKERIREVAARYELLGGRSPINAENRALLVALLGELQARGLSLPVYWGNRHWHPLLRDALGQMAADGVRRALAFVTSAFSSYPGCRQYLEDLERARAEVGPQAPKVDKLRAFYNHPGFIAAQAARVRAAWEQIPAQRRGQARLVYTAHSLPLRTARNCAYQDQLREACGLVSQELGLPDGELVYQSRSGPPSEPWLEPDVCDYLRQLGRKSPGGDVVIVPIGFVCEHMETVYDLDVVARGVCEELGWNMIRAGAVGCHPRFVQMIRELIAERLDPAAPRLALGSDGPLPDECPPDCCPRG
jgi:ferrochelatase